MLCLSSSSDSKVAAVLNTHLHRLTCVASAEVALSALLKTNNGQLLHLKIELLAGCRCTSQNLTLTCQHIPNMLSHMHNGFPVILLPW